MTTTLIAPAPGEIFVSCPSGTSYVADANGVIGNVKSGDVPAMLAGGCLFPAGVSASTNTAATLKRGVVVQPSAVTTPLGLATPLNAVTLPAFGPLTGSPGSEIFVDSTEPYQAFLGTGAAITDAAAYVLTNYLTATQLTALLTEAFGTNGLSSVRICMGSSDFTSRAAFYTYDDNGGTADTSLTNFSIAPDTQYIIPILQQILKINPRVRVLAMPWSPPAWLKSNSALIGSPSSFNTTVANLTTYAQYFVKFIQAYAALGVPIWAVSAQNEPNFSPPLYPGCTWAAADMATFIGTYLGPAFDAAGITTKILAGDASWGDTGTLVTTAMSTAASFPYYDGAAYHGYDGVPLKQAQDMRSYPTKSIHLTEWLVNFSDGNATGTSNMAGVAGVNATRNGASSITLWNFALTPAGGPYLNSVTNSSAFRGVISISSAGAITRNLEYYLLCHLAKYVQPGARRCKSSALSDVLNVSFVNPDGSVVVFLYNGASVARTVTITDAVTGQSVPLTMAVGDMTTMTWSAVNTATAASFTAPSAPTVAATTTNGIPTLTITAPTSIGTTDLGGYMIFRGTTPGGESSAVLAMLPKGTTSYADTSAVSGSTYYYTAVAFGGGGNSPASAEVSASSVATAPGAPSLSVTPGNTQNVLNYSTSNTGGAAVTSYNIYRGTSSGAETLLGNTTSLSSYTDSGLTNGTVYYYKVAAVNSVGTSAQSTEISAAPTSVMNYLSNTSSGSGSLYNTSTPASYFPGANTFQITALIMPSSLTNEFIFVNSWPNTGSPSTNNGGYLFGINNSGDLDLYFLGTDGSVYGGNSTTALPSSTTTTPLWVRALCNTSTGALTFSTSTDGSTWTQLGTVISFTSGKTVNTPGTKIGVVSAGVGGTGANLAGNIYYLELDISSAKVFSLDFRTATVGASSITDSAGLVWTVASPAAIS